MQERFQPEEEKAVTYKERRIREVCSVQFLVHARLYILASGGYGVNVCPMAGTLNH